MNPKTLYLALFAILSTFTAASGSIRPADTDLRRIREIANLMNNPSPLKNDENSMESEKVFHFPELDDIYQKILNGDGENVPPVIRLYLLKYFNKMGMTPPSALTKYFDFQLINEVFNGAIYFYDEDKRIEIIKQMLHDGLIKIEPIHFSSLMEHYVRNDKFEELRMLIDLYGHYNIPLNVLYVAVQSNNVEMVKMILEISESILHDYNADDLLTSAIQMNNHEMVDALVMYKHKLEFSPDINVLAHGAADISPNVDTIVKVCEIFPIDADYEKQFGISTLSYKVYQYFAYAEYETDFAKVLFRRLDRNKIYGEILYATVRNDDIDATRFVLENTGNFDFSCSYGNADSHISLAITLKNFEMINLLLDYKDKLVFSDEMPSKVNENLVPIEEDIARLRNTFPM